MSYFEVQPGDGNIAMKSGGAVVGITYSITSKVLSIDPVENLNYSISYAVYIPAGVVMDISGNALAGDYSFIFTTMPVP
ncbi:MAG: Ig-like domain-containing protein [Candidatus Auribacterota bacterium]